MRQTVLFRAEGLAPLVSIADDGELLAMLGQVMLGWRIVQVPGPAPEVDIRIERGPDGWTCAVVGEAQKVLFRDPVAAACGTIAAIYKRNTLIDLNALVLHAAGVRIGDGLVVLTGHYRAGKTIVATACAAAGLQVFSDDIIPLEAGSLDAVAPGLAIRLRLPLPETLGAATRDLVDSSLIAESAHYAYLRPAPDRLAWRGARAPIRGVVTLRRADGAAARLRRMAAGDALAETIRRNFAREAAAGGIIDAFDDLVQRAPCLVLDYDRAEDAVAALRSAFEDGSPEFLEMAELQAPDRKRSRRTLGPDVRLARAPGVTMRERGGQAFLTDAAEQVIFNLNATGLAVWRVLEDPATFADLAALFAAAFPDRPRGDIEADLSALLRDVAAAKLVRLE